MFRWRKRGKVFDPAAVARGGWMNQFAQAPATLVFDTFGRVYFSCRPPPEESGQYVSRAAYVDLDRANLFEIVALSEQPIMSLGELSAFDQFGTYPTLVVRHGDEIRAYCGGWTRCASVPFDVAIGYAVSRDGGVTFEKRGRAPAGGRSARAARHQRTEDTPVRQPLVSLVHRRHEMDSGRG